jgi:hypothetical protein
VSQTRLLTGISHRRTQEGFQLIDEEARGLDYLAVSDANGAEVDALLRSLTAVQ